MFFDNGQNSIHIWNSTSHVREHHELWIVFSDLLLKATVDVNFKSEMYLDYDLDERVRQSGFGKVNARVALGNNSWELAFYGRNIGDKTTHSFMLDTPLLSGATTGWVDEGRVLGAELTWTY